MTLLYILIAVVIVGLMAREVYKTIGSKNRAMAHLAEDLGLPLMGAASAVNGNTPFILDLWRGRELNIYHIVKGSGKTHSASVALDVPVAADPDYRFSLTAVGWMTQTGLQLGQKPVGTGDDAFDKQFAVKSSMPEITTRILSETLRKSIAEAWDIHDVRGVLSIKDGRVHYEEPGWLRTDVQRRRLAGMAALCNALAEAIEPCFPEKA